jgi:hypothetical protein
MRFKDLNEASFASFADQAVETIDKLTSTAGKAYGAFKGAKEKAESGIKSDIKAAQAEAEKEKEKAEREAEKGKAGKNKKLVENIPALVAKVVLDRTPDDPDMIEEFHALGADDFNKVYTAIDKATDRIAKFPREMRKALKASDFLQAIHKSDAELNDMLGEQPDKGIDPAEEMLLKNLFDEQSVWTEVLTSDDLAGSAQHMISLIKAISRDFERRNLAGTGVAAKKKSFPEGTGIVRILSTQRQIIMMRLGLLKTSIDQLAEKPVTEAAMRRVRKLLERMR